MKKNPEPDPPADDDLFRQALKDVTPLTHSNRIPIPSPARRFLPRSSPLASGSIADNVSDHGASDIAPVAFLRPGLNRMTLRKLRRGQWPIQDAMDFHGFTTEEARRALAEFLHHASQQNMRCVSVIHGKGWRAEGGEGVLKLRIRHWLTQYAQVLAFCEAPANAGGGGAVWVLLKSTAGESLRDY